MEVRRSATGQHRSSTHVSAKMELKSCGEEAQRLIAEIAVETPLVVLHGCTTLLQRLTSLADPSASRWVQSSERYLAAVVSAMLTLHKWRCDVVHDVLRSTLMGVARVVANAASTYVGSSAPRRCTIGIHEHTPVLLSEWLQNPQEQRRVLRGGVEDGTSPSSSSTTSATMSQSELQQLLFCGEMVCETTTELVRAAFGVCHIVREVAHDRLHHFLSAEERHALLQLAAFILAVRLDEPSRDEHQHDDGGRRRRLEPTSSSLIMGTNQRLHRTAGALVELARGEGWLLPDVHGPMMLYTLVMRLSAHASVEDVEAWEGSLLMWLVRSIRDGVVQPSAWRDVLERMHGLVLMLMCVQRWRTAAANTSISASWMMKNGAHHHQLVNQLMLLWRCCAGLLTEGECRCQAQVLLVQLLGASPREHVLAYFSTSTPFTWWLDDVLLGNSSSSSSSSFHQHNWHALIAALPEEFAHQLVGAAYTHMMEMKLDEYERAWLLANMFVCLEQQAASSRGGSECNHTPPTATKATATATSSSPSSLEHVRVDVRGVVELALRDGVSEAHFATCVQILVLLHANNTSRHVGEWWSHMEHFLRVVPVEKFWTCPNVTCQLMYHVMVDDAPDAVVQHLLRLVPPLTTSSSSSSPTTTTMMMMRTTSNLLAGLGRGLTERLRALMKGVPLSWIASPATTATSCARMAADPPHALMAVLHVLEHHLQWMRDVRSFLLTILPARTMDVGDDDDEWCSAVGLVVESYQRALLLLHVLCVPFSPKDAPMREENEVVEVESNEDSVDVLELSNDPPAMPRDLFSARLEKLVMELRGHAHHLLLVLHPLYVELRGDANHTCIHALRDAIFQAIALSAVLQQQHHQQQQQHVAVVEILFEHMDAWTHVPALLGHGCLALTWMLQHQRLTSGVVSRLIHVHDQQQQQEHDESASEHLIISALSMLTTLFGMGWGKLLTSCEDDAYVEAITMRHVARMVEHNPSPWIREGQHLLEFGCRVWERNTTSPALRAALVEATHAMLQHTLRWSGEDCYRGYAYMACNSFFSAVLASLSALRERGVAMCAIDAVVGPRLIDSSQQAQEEVEMLVASHAAPGADRVALLFPPALAYVLHHCATEKPAERVRVLKHMAGRVGISMEKIPSLTHQWLIPIVVYITSMEADARLRQSMEMVLSTQQHAGAATPSTLWRLREATNTDTLQVALQHVVSLAECPSTPRGVARALELPVPLSVATHELSKSLLKLLDEVDLRMGLRRQSGATNATTSAAPSSSSATTTTTMMCSSWSRRRWLLGLAAMIRVLGHEAMLMEAKLAATLDILSTDPGLVEAVCLVQYELIHGAPSEHLVEHAAAMVANFVSLEQHGRLCAASLHLSQRALHLLHTKTPTSVVWQSFVQVLCARSALMADLGRDLGPTGNVAVANQALLLDGFIRVMDTSSIKCRAIFAQGLYEHLRAADRSSREAFSAAAAERGDVLPALLRCVREVSDEDAQYALKCLGLLGAMVPQPQIREKATHNNSNNNNNTHGSSSSSSSSPPSSSSSSLTQSRGLQVESVLHWRVLAATLLGEFCYRAMSNTTDAGIHDRTGYAVQELIRACCQAERVANCGPPLREEELVHVEELQRYSWWSAVPPSAQRLLTPFLTTKLVLHIYSEKERRSPNYTTGMPFQAWLVGFFSTLTAHCRSTFVEMIVPFHNLAKRSSGVMEFLLPYVMVHLIEGGEHKAWEAMLVEMEAIFSSVKEVPSGGAATTPTATTATTMQQHEDDLSSHRRISTQEHIHLLLHVVEDLAHLRWLLLRVGHRIDRKPELQDADVQACVLLAAKVESFLHRLPWSKRALAAEAVGSHMVALRCVEASNGLPVHVDELKRLPMQALFAALNDRDSARSLHRSRPSATPEEAAFSCEHNGDWQSALQHSELALQRRPDSFPHQVIALRCMRQLCQLQLMLRYGNALLTEMQDGRRRRHTSTTCSEVAAPHRMEVIQNFANDAAWRLGEWSMMMEVGEEVNVEVAPPSLATPVFRLVQQLDEGGSKNRLVQRAVEEECRKLTASIRAASTEGYSMQVYPHVALLHGLMDVVYVDELMTGQREMPKSGLRTIIREHLSTRLHLTDATLDSREPLLALHRTIYGTLGMQEEVAHTWMEQAELLRRSGFNEPALGAARRALLDGGGTSMNASLYAMMMELLVEVHSPLQAIEFAEEQIRHNADLCPAISAFLHVSITKLRVEIGSQTPAEVLASYSTALHLHESERVHHHIALFYDHLFTLRCPNPPHLGGEGSEVAMSELLSSTESLCMLAMDHFGRSLRLGSSRVWVSLPRMLTLWLDTTLRLSHISDAHRSHARARVVLDKLNQLMKSFLVGPTAIAPQILITALSQLLSRLIHPCSAIITHAITHLMTIFPQQCLWLVLPICFSKQENRAKCAKNEVLRRFADTNTANAHILSNAFDIFSCLSAICNAPASTFTNNNNNVSLRQQPYVTLLEPKLPQANFILPTMSNLCPNIHAATQAEVFPTGPTFHHFDDRVEVMSSMQKPKRIWIVSNEGHTVPFLCKSKDEPRKDIRMMEIASLINTLFLTDAEARRRHFSLRRYSIAALNDDCAVIEWVHDVSPLRAVVYQHSGLMSTGVRVSQVRAWHAKVESKVLTKMKLFTDHILPAAPPILHFWFDSQFRSVESWYEARKLFTQSTALWSIAGHIVGLGDRHSENLMLDTVRGEMMHVDFACMFDKGELLEVPEVVRFRLTPNMVDGMGIAGTDGPFRAACEIALRCQMMHRTAVMSVVETLLHDPLVEWSSRNSKKSVDPKPLFDRVARRLNGYLDLYSAGHEKDTLALNVESQVAKLISHASALENLSEMYIWWMAWV